MVLAADHVDHPSSAVVPVPAPEGVTTVASRTCKIALTGAAGLVGQNLVPRLKERGFGDIIAIDKHHANTAILRELHPDVTVIEADLARDDGWQEQVRDADVAILSHAQIGGLDRGLFTANNVTATRRFLDAIAVNKDIYVVHLSSSVVNSAATDWYVESKAEQEKIVTSAGFEHVVLRPTLMFGWFDRKHLGWLSRFMRRVPVFPVPGHGRYLRQPLYAGDFCNMIISCIERRITGAHNISGLERIDYIDLIRAVKEACGTHAAIVRIPYSAFWLLLRTYGLFDSDPPFTAKQLEALVTPDVFEVIDWPGIFGVTPTPLREALRQTFQHPTFSQLVLKF
jgi:nucleoside-diphosphate-sugar epimerase